MRFSICLIEPEGYKYSHFLYDFCKYLCFTIEATGHECCMVKNKYYSDRINIILGSHNLKDPASVEQIKRAGKSVIVQSEVLREGGIAGWPDQPTFHKIYVPLMQQASAVWDGIESNHRHLQKLGIQAQRIPRFGYLPTLEEIVHKKSKDIDFLYYGSLTPHRIKLINELKARGGNVVCIFDEAAIFRNDYIARTRVHLAPNQIPGINYVNSRILYLLNNHAVVVSERCRDQEWIEHCFPSSDAEGWANLCMETLRRPDLDQLADEYFEHYKKLSMVNLFQPLLDKFSIDQKASSKIETSISSEIQKPSESVVFGYDLLLPRFKEEKALSGLTSIIIPVQSIHLDECVSFLKKYTDEPHEIIFLGHGVAPKLKKHIMKFIKENRNYKFIEIDKASNFSQSLNEGINQSTGEYIVLLFDDVVVCKNWLSDMLECLHSGKKIGIVGAMSDDASSLQRVEDIDFNSPENRVSFRERNRHRKIHTRNLDGFCMLFRRDLPIRIGLFHEILGEDKHVLDDFCARAVLEGYNNVVAGDVFIHHYGSMSFIMNRTDYDSALKMNDFREKWSNIDQKNIFGKKLVAIGALDRAQEFKHRGQTDKAVQILLETLDSIHEEREIYYFLVEILIDIKKYDEALKILESIPDDSDTDISKLVLIGYCKEGLGLLTEAVGYAEQVLCLDTSNAAALNLKGILAYKQNHYQAAEELFRKAIKVDPGYGKPYCNLGLLNLATGQHQEALRLMEQGFILSPTSTDIAASYHNAVTMSKQFARAEIIFRETKVIYPHNKQIIFLLIDLLLRQVKYADAMVEIEQAMVLFGYEQGILAAALDIRNKIGPKEIDAASKKNNPLSLCMVVKNDEPNLARCFKNIKSIAQEIIIVDLCSNDRTKEIATAFGAKVYDAPKTENMDELRSFSFAKATGDWILVLDADESISPLDYPPLTNLIAQQGLRQTAYAFIIRNYLTPVHLPGWIANDGKYINEETGTGWVPSKKVRLFPKDNRIRFSNSACETLASSLNDLGICIESCEIPIHHYGKLDVV